nr:transmembrane 7 superfamily member 3-like [Osmia lignaria]
MNRSFVRKLLIFLLLLASCVAAVKKLEVYDDDSVLEINLRNLRDSIPYIKQIYISPSSNVTLSITNISSNIAFYIVQIHAHLHPVTLSYDANYKTSIYGSNIGLYVKSTFNKVSTLFFKNEESYAIKAMLVIMGYNDKAPIPGGCNMEFETEIAPYAKVLTSDTMIVVDVQAASLPLINGTAQTCEKSPVTLEMYQVFLPEQDRSVETYFSYITSMLTASSIKEHGQEITSSVLSNPMRRIFNAYTGTGSVYVAVANYGKYSAAYVPALSYGCNPVGDPESCQVLNDSYSKFVCACCFFIGLFSVFCGHKCPIVDKTVPVFFTATMIGYIAAGQSITAGWVIGLVIAAVYGLCQHFLVFRLLLVLTLGSFFGCVAYFRFPESFIITQSDGAFWALFATIAVSVSIIKLILYSCTRGLLSCAIIGSYMIILPFDYYTGSALKYIIINIARRCTVSDFRFAIIQPPVQSKDITLIVLWTLLAIWRCLKGFSVPILCQPSNVESEETTHLLGEPTAPSAPSIPTLNSFSQSYHGYRGSHRGRKHSTYLHI